MFGSNIAAYHWGVTGSPQLYRNGLMRRNWSMENAIAVKWEELPAEFWRELRLGMQEDADGKIFQILNRQHFMERKDAAMRKWSLCAGEWVVPSHP